MRDECNASAAERGKILREGTGLVPPIYVDREVLDYLAERAAARASLAEFVRTHATQEGYRTDRSDQIALRPKTNFPSNLSLFLRVQPFFKKYFALSEAQIMRIVSPS